MPVTRSARLRALEVQSSNVAGNGGGTHHNDQENRNFNVTNLGENAPNEGNGGITAKATTLLPAVANNKNKNKRKVKNQGEKSNTKHARVALQVVTNTQPQGKANVPTKLEVARQEPTRAHPSNLEPAESSTLSLPPSGERFQEDSPQGLEDSPQDVAEEYCAKEEAGRKSLILTSSKTSSLTYQFGPADDIDAKDAKDPINVADYVQSLYQHFRSKEYCRKFYMDQRKGTQPHISEIHRTILVDWLIEVHYKFKLHRETLYLAIHVLDEFLAKNLKRVSKTEMQLIGVTALFLASKYEEKYIPELRDLTYICDGAYTDSMILGMEETILKTLNYNLTVPTAHHFLIRFLKAAHADKLMVNMSCYILDGSLLTYEALQCRYLPSQLAAAVIMIARRAVRRHDWSPTLLHLTKYRQEDVEPVALAILKAKERRAINMPTLISLERKYSKIKYMRVAEMELPAF